MPRHEFDCPAEIGDSDICTCGAVLRWALDAQRPRPWRPEPRGPSICAHILDDQAEEFGR